MAKLLEIDSANQFKGQRGPTSPQRDKPSDKETGVSTIANPEMPVPTPLNGDGETCSFDP
jgi:hypothetical protein